MADFFDRLLARHAPPGAAAPVRPRLPGPFERIGTPRAQPPLPETGAPAPPDAAPPLGRALPGAVLHHLREIRTEHRTVLQTEPASPVPPEGPRARPGPPLLRPEAQPLPARPAERAPRPGPDVAAPAPSGPATGHRPPTPSAPAPGGATGVPSVRAAAAAVPRPGPDGTDAARARRPAGSRQRTPRRTERTVHVRIGQLTVSAAGTGAGPAGPRTEHPARRGPAVGLAAYLSAREEKRS